MTTATRQAEQAVELHPIFHEWYVQFDEVWKRDRKQRPLIVRREEKCENCPTLRYTRIHVQSWSQIGHRTYKYVKGVLIIRMTKQEFAKKGFLATTTLRGEDLEALR